MSQLHLQQYPLCGDQAPDAYPGWRGECYEQGILAVATCTDHIIPIRLGGDVFDPRNLSSKCNRCNTIKTQKHE